MTMIRIASLLVSTLLLAAGCGSSVGGSGVGGPGGYNTGGPAANDPATQGMDKYLAGDFQGALDSCRMLQQRDMTSDEMQFHVRGCLALRPAIFLLSGDHATARNHIAAGCESAPSFGHDKDHYCAFVVVTFSIHATDEQFVAADKVLADTFLIECGVSVGEINTIIDEMKAAMEQQSQGGYY
jgi:hypothetical protein